MCNEFFFVLIHMLVMATRSVCVVCVAFTHSLPSMLDCIVLSISVCKWFLPFKRFTHCHTLVIFNVIIFWLDARTPARLQCCVAAFFPLGSLLYAPLRVLFIAQFHSITCWLWYALPLLSLFSVALYHLIIQNKCINYSICSFQFDCHSYWPLSYCGCLYTQTHTLPLWRDIICAHTRSCASLLTSLLLLFGCVTETMIFFLSLIHFFPPFSSTLSVGHVAYEFLLPYRFFVSLCALRIHLSMSNTIISSNSNRITPFNDTTFKLHKLKMFMTFSYWRAFCTNKKKIQPH